MMLVGWAKGDISCSHIIIVKSSYLFARYSAHWDLTPDVLIYIEHGRQGFSGACF